MAPSDVLKGRRNRLFFRALWLVLVLLTAGMLSAAEFDAAVVPNGLDGGSWQRILGQLDAEVADAEADDSVDTVVQPDVAVICDPSKLDEKGCRGAPDWIVEVLSPGTSKKDQLEKRDLYERHGVHEYWLLHPTDQTLMIYRLDGASYGKPDVLTLEGETPVEAIDGLVIRWREAGL